MGLSWIEGSTAKGYVCINRADFTQAFKFSGIKDAMSVVIVLHDVSMVRARAISAPVSI